MARKSRISTISHERRRAMETPKHHKTFWNGQPCKAKKVNVVVAKAAKSSYWFAGLQGTTREAVRVQYDGDEFYLDNEDGSGWIKVTEGRGSPDYPHRSLDIERECESD